MTMRRHDLSLPDWGPYSKQYIGLSHIADPERGWRFDLSVIPGFYRRKLDIPNVRWESGYHPWEASPDLSYWCHRHELEWKDRVFTDVSFAGDGEDARRLLINCVNKTDSAQTLALHLMATLAFPAPHPAVVRLPAGAVWVDGLEYARLDYAVPHHTDGLVYDGLKRGERRRDLSVGGSVLGGGCRPVFGSVAGDSVEYMMDVPAAIDDALLVMRYRLPERREAKLVLAGLVSCELSMKAEGGGFALTRVPAGRVEAGRHRISVKALAPGQVEIDGFALVPASGGAELEFVPETRNPVPEITDGPVPGSVILRYDGVSHVYGVRWSFPGFIRREILNDELDTFLRNLVHDHVNTVLTGNRKGHFTDIYLHPVQLPPQSELDIRGFVCRGSLEEVCRRLESADLEPVSFREVFRTARRKVADMECLQAGEKYRFSQQRMAATALAGVVYPVYTRSRFIRHNTPGRWWDFLYTWDLGFVALGLAEYDARRSFEALACYLTEPDTRDSAFIHHGTPLPVQHYAFQNIWNTTQRSDWLEWCYPRLRQYHDFLMGRTHGSVTRNLKSGLLRTWDYFYNSGGWDDYPPQHQLQQNRINGKEPGWADVTPCCNSAHAIRTARILQQAAKALGYSAELERLEQDVKELGNALQAYAWDEEAGYFSYVLHDRNGVPAGFFRHASGGNFNCGLDGVAPLVAGICTAGQEEKLLARIFDPGRLWSQAGITAVDQSAPYYNAAGYWSGTVWFPHQWFIWKTMLDMGRADLAWQIAETGLNVWRREVEESYHCFEHFVIESGRGAGWHQFTGLSLPVACWFGAYFRPGHFTAGLDVWIAGRSVAEDHTEMRFELDVLPRASGRSKRAFLAVLNPAHHYHAGWNGRPVEVSERFPGTLEIEVEDCCGNGVLAISPRRA